MRTRNYIAEKPYSNGDKHRLDITLNERDLHELVTDLKAIPDISQYPKLKRVLSVIGTHFGENLSRINRKGTPND